MNKRLVTIAGLAAMLAASMLLAGDGANGRGEFAALVEARPSIGFATIEGRRADGVGVIVAIDPIAPGTGRNGRGEYIFVGPWALVAHLAVNNTNLADWEKY